ncbi:dTDP-glucose 4,6-dehydratase [Humibacillus xanthopallidus]|uniref:dTDP-glucose 4,6-dehydratase n=1 Tax=Humibacillus xanthopallidus TaxID=412689 RepID=A0A543PXM0_9MICO|nr:nucleoside-diphosphate sugar epimerase/dehydratase [Humibacillus xanthopallidus]TQN48822.1 dTDP-glucose 4,6-dehydratase [Humibacillus xanthopallidus]
MQFVRSSVNLKRSVMVGWDVLAWALSFAAFVLVRFDLELSDRVWQGALAYLAAAIVLQVIAGFRFHLYLGRSRIGSYDEVTLLGSIVLGIAVALGVFFSVTQPVFSRGLVIAMPALAFLVMAAGRWVFRATVGTGRRNRNGGVSPTAKPALIYGVGDAGHQVARLVEIAEHPPYSIVGYIDDDPAKRYLRVRGQRVRGRGDDVVHVARSTGAEIVILAVTQATPQLLQALSERCKSAGLDLIVVPPVREMIAGRVELDQLREFNVADLLGRRPIESDLSEISDYVAGKVVLVTGAGGSIGSELSRQVSALGPARLVLLDRDESALHAVQLTLDGSGLLDSDDLVLCDIRDHAALTKVFEKHRPDVVFHAAALKHLPMLERHPEEGWKTNVLGSVNVLRCAHESGVRHFVNISTDKAADPTSVLGQTKRLAERLTAWYAAETGLPYLSVRFGNVLGSRGSVLDTFRAQIERGGPVTVTHPEVTRYFMTIPEACELVLQAGAIGRPGDVLVLDMGEPVRIVDVARRLIDESDKDIEIEFAGLRQGEKLHEVLLSDAEKGAPSSHPLITQVSVPHLEPREVLVEDADVPSLVRLLRRPSSLKQPADSTPMASSW